eukprot:CAMPEP_0113695746 /NCGR_PEP_ID=MMETSP0038_2-20120614/21082_1 /TAXON_ID=2898 /ORGANISM="Cryptomonas paramecium" /LENGTH=38 /DNA_ID=CAMNT_0000618345 /DNA_START=38 /DNA_END=150 /DNA_ORIENTATION=+ /assembly_acc=CAM_ASM_000170
MPSLGMVNLAWSTMAWSTMPSLGMVNLAWSTMPSLGMV